MSIEKQYCTVLSIAGSDSIGGAGIQADIKTCSALGVYAMTAITAITAQNTTGVKCFEAVSPRMLKAQLEAVSDDIIPDAVKIGMLPDSESIKIVAEWLEHHRIANVVVDPVMVATSGHALTSAPTVNTLTERLFPLATLITPNLPEVLALTGIEGFHSKTAMQQCCQWFVKHGVATLIKGGHFEGTDELTDTLVAADGTITTYRHNKFDTPNTHGTGCSLSTAIAAFIAMGNPLQQAVNKAIDWLQKALEAGADVKFGHGHGPVNHLFNNAHYKQS